MNMKWHIYPTANNGLAKLNPELCKEWSDRNGNPPSVYTAKSGKKAWWECRICGHIWLAEIRSRHLGRGCPKCAIGCHTSKAELRLYSELKFHFPDAIGSYRIEGVEADIFIPSIFTVIEFDGWKWHKDKIESDKSKSKHFRQKGLRVVRVREGLPPTSDDDVVCRKRDSHENIVQATLSHLGIIQKGFRNDGHYREMMSDMRRVNPNTSLEKTHPYLVGRWSDRNYPLSPNHVSKGSTDKVWWKCDKGHEWRARVDSVARSKKGHGCPTCAGFHDLRVSDTKLAAEWSDKNSDSPKEIRVVSLKNFWWYCRKHNHHYKRMPHSRYYSNIGCPFCGGSVPTINESLCQFPKISARWDYQSNGNLRPEHVRPGSGKKVWWLDRNGNSVQKIVREVVGRKSDF